MKDWIKRNGVRIGNGFAGSFFGGISYTVGPSAVKVIQEADKYIKTYGANPSMQAAQVGGWIALAGTALGVIFSIDYFYAFARNREIGPIGETLIDLVSKVPRYSGLKNEMV